MKKRSVQTRKQSDTVRLHYLDQDIKEWQRRKAILGTLATLISIICSLGQADMLAQWIDSAAAALRHFFSFF